MQIAIHGQSGETVITEQLVAGSANLYAAAFDFDAAWDGFAKTAIFKAGGLSKEKVLVDDRCTVPHEVLIPEATLYVGVYGMNGAAHMPTVWVRVGVVLPGADQPGTQPPTPTVYEQLLTAMGDMATLKTDDKTSLVAAINEIWSRGGGGGGTYVTDATVNEEGHLIITLSDETVFDAGYVVGPAGAPGEKGAPFTYADFTPDQLEALRGPAGAPGEKGAPFTYEDFTEEQLAALTGPEGPRGQQGAPGKAVCVQVTLLSTEWDAGALTQAVAVPGVSADEAAQLIIPAPSLASQAAYIAAGVLCTGQAEGALTFTAKEVPADDLTVFVSIQEVEV